MPEPIGEEDSTGKSRWSVAGLTPFRFSQTQAGKR